MSANRFIVDVARCVGCYTCAVACKDRAGLPDDGVDLLRVETHEEGAYPRPSLYFRVVHCFHCDEPACVEVCPTGALAKGPDGLVRLDAETCSGCGDCLEACPFSALVMLPEGIAAKCDACADELARGWEPTCVRACPMRALRYETTERALPQGRIPDPAFDGHGIGPAVLYLRRTP